MQHNFFYLLSGAQCLYQILSFLTHTPEAEESTNKASTWPSDYHISSAIRQSFSFQNNPKTLDPPFKKDLALWDCLRKVKLMLY